MCEGIQYVTLGMHVWQIHGCVGSCMYMFMSQLCVCVCVERGREGVSDFEDKPDSSSALDSVSCSDVTSKISTVAVMLWWQGKYVE